jgi:hypothetical protein
MARITPSTLAIALSELAKGESLVTAARRARISKPTLIRHRQVHAARWDGWLAELRGLHVAGAAPKEVSDTATQLILGREPRRSAAEHQEPITWRLVEGALKEAIEKPAGYWHVARKLACQLAQVEHPEEIPNEDVLRIAWQLFRDPKIARDEEHKLPLKENPHA